MFKKTLLAATVAALLPTLAQAEISIEPIHYVPDPWKTVPELDWDVNTTYANSISKVHQEGFKNEATVDQTAETGLNAGQAMSVIVQDGRMNQANVTEDATSVRSSVLQEGRKNVANIDLGGSVYGPTSSFVEQYGRQHDTTVVSRGSLNWIGSFQYDHGQKAAIDVWGNGNEVRSAQEGDSNSTTIGIDGSLNKAFNDQGGEWNASTTTVAGNFNTTATNQWGYENTAIIDVTGSKNLVRAFQDSEYSTSDVTIDHGDLNRVLTYQDSEGSLIDIDINGDLNRVTASQEASVGDRILVNLAGGSDRNRIQAFQGDLHGSKNGLIDVELTGSDYNFVASAQNGQGHESYVTISHGDLNVVKVDQYGDRNVSTNTID